jgi:hypothetical protein
MVNGSYSLVVAFRNHRKHEWQSLSQYLLDENVLPGNYHPTGNLVGIYITVFRQGKMVDAAWSSAAILHLTRRYPDYGLDQRYTSLDVEEYSCRYELVSYG